MGDKTTAVVVIVTCLVLAAISAFLSIFFLKMKMSKSAETVPNPNKSTNIILTTSSSTIDINKYTTTSSNLDNETRIRYNQELKVYIEPLLASLVVLKDEPNLLNNVNYNTNMLKDNDFKYSLVLYMLLNDNIPRVLDGNTLKVNVEEFNNYYYRIYGDAFNIDDLLLQEQFKYPTTKPYIKDNYLYATINNVYKDKTYMDIKAVNREDNTISTDIIVYETADDYNNYCNTNIFKYPYELIYTKLEFTFENDKLTKLVFRTV